MNEFRHDKDFIVVIKQIIKSKEDFLLLRAWARAQARSDIAPISLPDLATLRQQVASAGPGNNN